MCDDPACHCASALPGPNTTAGPCWTPAQRAHLADLFERLYHRAVAQVMLWTGARQEDAEDAVMDAVEAALQDPGQWSQAVRNPGGWLCTVAVRCYKRPPGRTRRPVGVFDDPVAEFTDDQLRAVQSRSADDPIELSMQLLLVREVLQTLPEHDRLLMVASMNGLSWAETARLLGLDDQYVRNRAKVIRKTMEDRFADLRTTRRKGRSK